MRAGDILRNPYVSREYNGKLNPLYNTIYIGDGITVDYELHNHRFAGMKDFEVVGHIDLKSILLNACESVL